MDSDAENRLVVPALQKAGCEPDRPPSTCTGARGPRDDRCVGHRVTLQVVNAPVILGPHKTSLGERRHQCLVGEPRGRDECGRIRAEAGPEGFATPVDPIAHLGGAETQELAFAGREKSTFEPGPQRSSIGSPRLWLLVMVPVKAPVHVERTRLATPPRELDIFFNGPAAVIARHEQVGDARHAQIAKDRFRARQTRDVARRHVVQRQEEGASAHRSFCRIRS